MRHVNMYLVKRHIPAPKHTLWKVRLCGTEGHASFLLTVPHIHSTYIIRHQESQTGQQQWDQVTSSVCTSAALLRKELLACFLQHCHCRRSENGAADTNPAKVKWHVAVRAPIPQSEQTDLVKQEGPTKWLFPTSTQIQRLQQPIKMPRS